METHHLVLGVILALTLLSPITCVYNAHHGRKFLATLWFLFLMASCITLVWYSHIVIMEFSRILGESFADVVVSGLKEAANGGVP